METEKLKLMAFYFKEPLKDVDVYLKPCGKCNAKAEVMVISINAKGRYTVKCKSCKNETAWWSDVKTAVEDWNSHDGRPDTSLGF